MDDHPRAAVLARWDWRLSIRADAAVEVHDASDRQRRRIIVFGLLRTNSGDVSCLGGTAPPGWAGRGRQIAIANNAAAMMTDAAKKVRRLEFL